MHRPATGTSVQWVWRLGGPGQVTGTLTRLPVTTAARPGRKQPPPPGQGATTGPRGRVARAALPARRGTGLPGGRTAPAGPARDQLPSGRAGLSPHHTARPDVRRDRPTKHPASRAARDPGDDQSPARPAGPRAARRGLGGPGAQRARLARALRQAAASGVTVAVTTGRNGSRHLWIDQEPDPLLTATLPVNTPGVLVVHGHGTKGALAVPADDLKAVIDALKDDYGLTTAVLLACQQRPASSSPPPTT